MATNGEAFYPRKGCFVHAFRGLVLSAGGILLQEPLLSLSLNKGPDNISIFTPVIYAYLFLLNPLTFYLNMLFLFLLHVKPHAGAAEASRSVFLKKNLPRAANAVSFATLLFAAPLWGQAAITEGSIGLAILATLACLSLVTIFTSVFKKLLIASCHAGRGFIPVPALFSLCISAGIIIFASLTNITLNYLLLFVVFSIFMIGITLLILWISAPAEGHQAAIQAEQWAVVALSVAFATLIVGAYMNVSVAVADGAAVGVNAVEKQVGSVTVPGILG